MDLEFTKDERPTMENFNKRLHYIYDNGVPKVGDTLTTARTDLGDNWLLCNGDRIGRNTYPDLIKMFPPYAVYDDIQDYSHWATDGNGRWVKAGWNTSNRPYVTVYDDWGETITGTCVITTYASRYVYDCVYHNGLWTVLSNDSSGHLAVFTATNPLGTWTETSINVDTATSHGSTRLCCYNGRWVVVTQIGSSVYVYTATSPTEGWTKTTISNFYGKSITCDNGTWVISGYVNQSNTYYPQIYYTTNPLGTWTGKQVSTNYGALTSIFCYNGRWVAAGYLSDTTSLYAFTATSLSGAWTAKEIVTVSGVAQPVVGYCDGEWIILSNGYYCTTDNPLGEWVCARLKSTAGQSTPLDNLCVSGNQWAAGYSGQANYACNWWATIPTISQDGVYTYIKAKED